MKTDIHFLSYLSQFFLEWEMFHTKVVGKIRTYIVCPVPPPSNTPVMGDQALNMANRVQMDSGSPEPTKAPERP